MPVYAAVDIGSNSLRLLVAEVTLRATGPPKLTVLAEDRQVTRLGESVFRSGKISGPAISAVTATLQRMRRVWQSYDVAAIRAVATSATRDASNQAGFIAAASKAIGCPVETISGQEEARLIQLGVQSHWPHPRQRILIVDVGGGSAELIVADKGQMETGYSRPLGAVRLQTTFLRNDPPTAIQLARMRDYIEEKLALTLPKLTASRYDRVIGTSSTAAAIVSATNRVARAQRASVDRMKVTKPQMKRLLAELSRRNVIGRRQVPGIGPRRAEIIVPGVAVFLAILETLQLTGMQYCAAGVREGLVADLATRRIRKEQTGLAREQRAVIERLAKQFGANVSHGRRLATFARTLFAGLQSLHRLPPYYERLLEAATYLCDTGHYISDTSHHKHSSYIVANSDLAGFTNAERGLIALLCRYHRKSMPSPRHPEFQLLPPDGRLALQRLIPLLRLVDGLDRTGANRVESLSCEVSTASVILTLRSRQAANLEEWAVERVTELFRQIYRRELLVKVTAL